jgi:predicted RNA-binding Zn ribbon-like protein
VEPPLWDWLGEPLAIDFANTTRRRGAVQHELLLGGDDVATWAQRQAGRVPAVAPRTAAGRLEEIRAARDDVQAVLHAAADGAPLPPRAAARLNARARAMPVVGQLGRRPGELGLAATADLSPVDELLARVAAATIALVGGAPADAVRFCDAPSCGQFFAPQRPNQRWCGPACGTRARVARHAAHRRETPSSVDDRPRGRRSARPG